MDMLMAIDTTRDGKVVLEMTGIEREKYGARHRLG